MALFVILPFVGAYVGYQLAPEKVVEVMVENQGVIKQQKSSQENQNTLSEVPVDAEHILFEGRKTGYFNYKGKIYIAPTASTEEAVNGNWDWIISGPATLVSEADALSFKVISAELAQTGSLYAIDNTQGYSFDKVLNKVDIESVEIVGKGGAFLLSNNGLYAGENLITNTSKKDIEIYIIKRLEGISSAFHIYIHDLVNNSWMEGGFGLETKEIETPKSSDLQSDLKLYPKN